MKDLIPVLESLSIGTAISLDDDYDTAYDPATQGMLRIDDFLNPPYRERFTEAEISEIEDSDAITISELIMNNAISLGTKDKVTALLKDLKERQALPALRFLEDEFKASSIEFQKIPTLDESLLNSEKGTIWFIDKEIKNHEILHEIVPRLSKNRNRSVPVIIIVFTNDIDLAVLNSSWNKRHEYLVNDLTVDEESAEWLSYSFFVVLKKEIEDHLPEDIKGAETYLDEILSASMSGYCTYQIVREMHSHGEKAVQHLLKAAKESNQRTFQNIQYNMVMEGEPNVYHAIKGILDYMQEREYLDDFEQCSRYLFAMKRLAHNPQQDTEKVSAQSLKDILHNYEWAQYQFIHKDVNRTFADVAHGDVFELKCSNDSDKLSIGVLISQPCDCILRKNGSRVKRNVSSFTLILFEEKLIYKENLEQPSELDNTNKQDKWKGRIQKLRDGGIILSREVYDDKVCAMYIDARAPVKALQIQPFVLDLISLDEEGKAVLPDINSLEQLIKNKKTNNWLEYYPTLKSEVEQHKERIYLLREKLGDRADEVICSLYGLAFAHNESRFCIERVGHLEDNLVELISYNYLTRTYRAGKNSLLSLNFELENGEGGI